MIIYKDVISEFLNVESLPQETLAEINAEFQQKIRDESLSNGFATWDKETFPDHPFVGGELQKEKVNKGTHHLQNSITAVGPKGDLVRIDKNIYENQTEYVNFQSDEGYIRRGLDPKKHRKIPRELGSTYTMSDNSTQKLKGENRTENQKRASLEHSKKMKGKKIWPEGRGIRSEEWRKNLSKPRKSMKFKEYKCPHCGKEGRGNSMARWHMDNCKYK